MTEKLVKCRLDTLMLQQGLVASRQRARAVIMAGKVLVNGVKMDKPGKEVPCEATVSMEEDLPFVSRGGLKLQAALEGFGVNCQGLSVLDAGASTGGFTDCLLQHGAARVTAVDVGYGQLHWKLRNDPRVVILERSNIRFLDKASLPGPMDAAVADLSFISLELILPRLAELVRPGGWVLVLVKPQFEVGRADVGKGGVVRDPEKIRRAVDKIRRFAQECGWEVRGERESPLRGPKGNREFFLHLQMPLTREVDARGSVPEPDNCDMPS